MPGFLESLTSGERETLEALGAVRSFPPGAALFREGDDGASVYVVVDGWVKVTVAGTDGREVLLGLQGPGELLGELSVLRGGGRSTTVVAAEPVRALALPGSGFRAWVERHPRAALDLLRITSERLFAADRRATEFASFDVLGRVARRLGDLAEVAGRAAPGGVQITIPLTQEELAGWVGASREAVSRALSSLRRLGWIEVERKRVTVLDPDALHAHTAR